MTRTAIIAIAGASVLALGACTGQSRYARPPIGISKSINGLQQSRCNCGGIEPEKRFKERRKAQARAQHGDKDGNE